MPNKRYSDVSPDPDNEGAKGKRSPVNDGRLGGAGFAAQVKKREPMTPAPEVVDPNVNVPSLGHQEGLKD